MVFGIAVAILSLWLFQDWVITGSVQVFQDLDLGLIKQTQGTLKIRCWFYALINSPEPG